MNLQKNCGIGGQAVIEGIMMRNGGEYSVACRKADGTVAMKKEPFRSVLPSEKAGKIPMVRGVVAFIDSLVVGISCLMYSADVSSEEETDSEADTEKTEQQKKKEKREWNLVMTGTVVFSIAFSVVLFMLLPFWIAGLLGRVGASTVLINVTEALLRVLIFLGYMLLISRMKDIQRVYAYHGAEHKCINCIEHGYDLTVENVMKSSRQHRRCGTSFLLIVICISVVAFLILGIFDIRSRAMRPLWRLILIPVIAGISYEILRYAGSHEGPVINALVKPGLMLQKLVTREPDEDMCAVAISAVEAVFDWRAWQEKNEQRADVLPSGAQSEEGAL